MKVYSLVQCGIIHRHVIGTFRSADIARNLFNKMYDMYKQDTKIGYHHEFDGWHNYVIREVDLNKIYAEDADYNDEDLTYEPLKGSL